MQWVVFFFKRVIQSIDGIEFCKEMKITESFVLIFLARSKFPANFKNQNKTSNSDSGGNKLANRDGNSINEYKIMDVPALDKSASKLRSIWCGNVVWLSVSCWGTWWKGISSKWLKLIPNWWSISSRFSSWRKGLLSPDVGRAWSSVLDGVEEGQGGRKWSPLPSSSASIIEEAASVLPGDQQMPPLPEKQTVTK